MNVVHQSDLDILNSPARILISGFSNSGKTYLVSKLLEKYISSFESVKVCGVPTIGFEHKKISYKESDYNPLEDDELEGATLVIYDDCMLDEKVLKVSANIFSKGRHKLISCIFITQNLFLPSKYFRVISLNASHVIVFKIRDISQISYFARTFLESSKQKLFLDQYRKNVTNKKYGYLLIDFSKGTDSNLFIRKNLYGKEYERTIIL